MVELVYGHLSDNSLIDAVSALPAAPETGNIRVTDTSVLMRPVRQMRQPSFEESHTSSARGGIEPPTRGFSDLKPTWPSPRIRCRKSVSIAETVAHLSQATASDSAFSLLQASPR